MECFFCSSDLPDDGNKCWLIENATDDASLILINVDPNPVHRECAAQMVGSRGGLGRTVIGFRIGQTQPASTDGGLILRR